MFKGKLPALIALPLFAIILSIITSFPYYFSQIDSIFFFTKLNFAFLNTINIITVNVLGKGVLRLESTIMVIILGGIFAQFLKLTGVAEKLVKSIAEFGSDNAFLITFLLTIMVSFLFSTLSGLGSIILIANIYIPVLLSLGIPPLLIASLFIMGLSLGGIFNMINWTFYIDLLHVEQSSIIKFAIPFSLIFLAILLLFMIIEFHKARIKISFFAILKIISVLFVFALLFLFFRGLNFDSNALVLFKYGFFIGFFILVFLSLVSKKFYFLAVFAPFIPLALVLFFNWNINTSFIVGIIYLFLTTLNIDEKINFQTSIKRLTQSSIEGAQSIVPAVVLMLGIGILLIAVTEPSVQYYLNPLLVKVLPGNRFFYVLFFTILAPLALYRGPFNIWGMGSGLMQLIRATGILPDFLIMTAFMTTGQIQGVCDPTNTYNVWFSDQLKIDLNAILKKTLPYMWLLVFLGLILSIFIPIK
jgi:hypothetical protein